MGHYERNYIYETPHLTSEKQKESAYGSVQLEGNSSLTMAQAVVRYLQVQCSERDGKSKRLIPAIFGIFGNVTGLGQALCEHGKDLPYYQPRNEQSMDKSKH